MIVKTDSETDGALHSTSEDPLRSSDGAGGGEGLGPAHVEGVAQGGAEPGPRHGAGVGRQLRELRGGQPGHGRAVAGAPLLAEPAEADHGAGPRPGPARHTEPPAQVAVVQSKVQREDALLQ